MKVASFSGLLVGGLGLGVVVAAGCGGGGGTGTGGSGGGTASSTTTSSTTTVASTGVTTGTGGSVPSDGNDSFDQAVGVDAAGTQATLEDPSVDVDYFTFDATAGDIYLISASSHPSPSDTSAGYVDTFIELYDSNKKLLATNDDRYPRSNTDSEIITL